MREYLVLLIGPEKKDKFDNAGAFFLDYFLSHADQIRLTQRESRVISLGFKNFSLGKKFGGDNDPEFQKTLELLKDDFVKKETDNELYHLDQRKGKVFNHYFYRLSAKIKDTIKEAGLLWMMYYGADIHMSLYGFEDPSFYKDNRLLGHVVSHENYVYLNLEEDVARDWERQLGLEFIDTTDFSKSL